MSKAGVSDARTQPRERPPAIRIAACANALDINPYKRLFYRAMGSAGLQWVPCPEMTNQWLRSHAALFDVVHLHRPESLWRVSRSRLGGPVRSVAALLEFLRAVRELNKVLVWTVHNLTPHEGANHTDACCFRLLATSADLLICHSALTRLQVVRKWHPRARTVVMEHGNYDGVYPDPNPRDLVLKGLGLHPSLPTLCALGGLRAYKNLGLIGRAAKLLGSPVQFIIGGMPYPSYDLASLTRSISDLPSVVLIARSLDDQEFADYLAASDGVVLPYTRITGSGAFLAAVTFGKGVIASDLPFFREMLTDHPAAGRLFRLGDAEALAQAIAAFLAIPASQRSEAARAVAEAHSWSKVVAPAVQAIRREFLRRRAAKVPRQNECTL